VAEEVLGETFFNGYKKFNTNTKIIIATGPCGHVATENGFGHTFPGMGKASFSSIIHSTIP
jgi:hypothetical protein